MSRPVVYVAPEGSPVVHARGWLRPGTPGRVAWTNCGRAYSVDDWTERAELTPRERLCRHCAQIGGVP